jgi:hypothetical protein
MEFYYSTLEAAEQVAAINVAIKEYKVLRESISREICSLHRPRPSKMVIPLSASGEIRLLATDSLVDILNKQKLIELTNKYLIRLTDYESKKRNLTIQFNYVNSIINKLFQQRYVWKQLDYSNIEISNRFDILEDYEVLESASVEDDLSTNSYIAQDYRSCLKAKQEIRRKYRLLNRPLIYNVVVEFPRPERDIMLLARLRERIAAFKLFRLRDSYNDFISLGFINKTKLMFFLQQHLRCSYSDLIYIMYLMFIFETRLIKYSLLYAFVKKLANNMSRGLDIDTNFSDTLDYLKVLIDNSIDISTKLDDASDLIYQPRIDYVGEMEESSAHGEQVITTDQSGDVILTSAREDCVATMTLEDSRTWNSMSTALVNEDLQSFTDRWFLLKNFKWSTTDTEDSEIVSLNLPYDILTSQGSAPNTMPNILPFLVHRYWSGDMQLRIMVNSNKFQVGQLQASFYYQKELDDKFGVRTLPGLVTYLTSQNEHVLINASSSNQATLQIPFKYPLPYLNCKPRTDMEAPLTLGAFYLRVLNPLVIGVNGPPSCSGTIYINFSNNKFTGMLASDVDPVVYTSEMEYVTMMGAMKLLDAVAADTNRDNPPAVIPAQYFVPTASHSWSIGTGIAEPVQPLRLDVRGQTRHPGVSLSEINMTVSSISSVFGLIAKYKWRATDTEGTVLFSYDAAPMLGISKYPKHTGGDSELNVYAMPPVAVASSLFNYWRGSIEFRFDVVASQFHTGMLLIAYIPGVQPNATVSLAQARASPHVVFTLQEQQQFTFTVPYIANKPWWPRRYAGNYDYDNVDSPSRLYAYVLNELTLTETVAPYVYINVYMRGGSDFEVAIPVQPSVGLSYNRTIVYPRKAEMQANKGYFPYYAGSWHSFVDGQYMIMRWGSVSDQIAQFMAPGHNPPTSVYYYKIELSSVAPRAKINGAMVPLIYATVFDSGHGYYVMVPHTKEDHAKSFARGIFVEKKAPSELKEFLISAENESSSTYCDGNPFWQAKNALIKDPTTSDVMVVDVVQTSKQWYYDYEGEREFNGTTLQPTSSLPPSEYGLFMYGENFNDLKTLCRRYQTYSMFAYKPSVTDLTGKCQFVLPILPQGLDLDVGTPDNVNHVANRCRDGHIPIIASGFRYYRGSIRLRILAPNFKDVAVWVQHRPDRKLRSLSCKACVDITTAESIANHTYASYVQATRINSILEVEIPFYQPGMYGLLQRPKILKTDMAYLYSLGEMVVGIVANPSDIDRNKTIVVTTYYSLADDMSFSTFQGFPPMALLDNISENLQYEPEMGLSSMFSSIVPSVNVNHTVDISGATASIFEKLSAIPEMAMAQTDQLTSSMITAFLTQVVHCVVNPTGKTIAWAIVSILMQFGIITLENLHKVAAMLTGAFVSSNFIPEGSSIKQQGEDLVVEYDANGFIEDLKADEFDGFISVIFMGLCSLLAITMYPPTSFANMTKFLVIGIGGGARASNSIYSFFKNTMGVVKKMIAYILGIKHPDLAALEFCESQKETLKVWVNKSITLLDVDWETKLNDMVYVQNISDCCSYGMIVMSELSLEAKSSVNAQCIMSIYNRLLKRREQLEAMGSNPYVRKEPYSIWLYGESGVGKSSLINKISKDLLKAVDYKTNKALTCIINPLDKYWSQCAHQPVLVIDDLFATQDPMTLPQQISALFSIKSPVVLTPPMAELEDKKMRYNPEIFFACSNYDFPVFERVHMDAIYRRRDILVKAIAGTKKRKDCPHCENNQTLSEVDASWLADMHHIQFQIHTNPKSPVPKKDNKDQGYGGVLTYQEFMDILIERYQAFFKAEYARYESRVADAFALHIDEEASNPLSVDITEKLIERKQYIMSQVQARREQYLGVVKDEISSIFTTSQELADKAYTLTVQKLWDPLMHKSVTSLLSMYEKYMPEMDNESQSKTIDEVGEEAFNSPKDQVLTYTDFLDAMKMERSFTLSKCKGVLDACLAEKVITKSVYETLSNVIYYIMSDDEATSLLLSLVLTYRKQLTYSPLIRDFNDFYQIVDRYRLSRLNSCLHSRVAHGVWYNVENCELQYGAGTFNTKELCNTNCWLRSRFFSVMTYLAMFKNSFAFREAYKARRDDLLPAFFKRKLSAITGYWSEMYQHIQTQIVTLYQKYLSGPVKAIYDFVSKYAYVILGVCLLGSAVMLRNTPRPSFGHDVMDIVETKVSSMRLDKMWNSESPLRYSTQTKVIKGNTSIPDRFLGQSESQQASIIDKKILENTIIIKCIQSNGTTRSCRGLVLKGRTVLILRHYLEEFSGTARMDPNQTYYLSYAHEPEKRMLGGTVGLKIDLFNLPLQWFGNKVMDTDTQAVYHDSNIGLLELPAQFPESKNIIKFIATREQHRASSGVGRLISPGDRIYANLQIRVDNTYPMISASANGLAVRMEYVYAYNVHGKGMCGSCLVVDNLQSPIIGIHVAGSEHNGRGLSEVIYREMFENVPILEQSPVQDVHISNLNDVDNAKLMLDTVLFPYGTVPNGLAHSQGGKSIIRPSGIHGVFPVTTEPAPLTASDERIKGCKTSPLRAGCNKHGEPGIDFPIDIVEEAYKDLRDCVLSKVKPVRSSTGILSLEEAVVGIPELVGYEPLEWCTSPGFPLINIRPSGESGKRFLFDLVEHKQGYKLAGLHSELRRQIEVTQEMRRRGIVPMTVYTDCLKDACISKEKCRIVGKTRVFSVAPVQFTIPFRQYCMDFMASYQNARIDMEHAIGIDVNSREWTDLYMHLRKAGDKFVAGDYSNFGPGLHTQLAEKAAQIVIDWYKQYSEPTEEDQRIRAIMFKEIIQCYHLCLNLIYKAPCGIPSGSPITDKLNSLVNQLYIRVMWKLITKQSFTEFHEHVKFVTYGDDVLLCISDKYIDIFNMVTLNRTFALYGVKFTDADKGGEIKEYKTNMNDFTFLKHKWVAHPFRKNIFLAKLDENSIFSACNWIKDRGNLRESTIENAKQSLELAFGHGVEYYTRHAEILRSAIAEKYNEHVVFPTWHDLDQRMYSVL